VILPDQKNDKSQNQINRYPLPLVCVITGRQDLVYPFSFTVIAPACGRQGQVNPLFKLITAFQNATRDLTKKNGADYNYYETMICGSHHTNIIVSY
jgi:hypothetical protein